MMVNSRKVDAATSSLPHPSSLCNKATKSFDDNHETTPTKTAIPSPTVVTSDSLLSSSEVNDTNHHNRQHEEDDDEDSDDSLPQHSNINNNTSFTLMVEDLSKFPRELSRKIDWITRCNSPVEFLRSLGLHPPGRRKSKQQQQHPQTAAVLDDDDDFERVFDDDFGYHEVEEEEENVNPYVAFQVPQHCEYCGAASTDQCLPLTCPRPLTFFPKQRPPFAKPNAKLYGVEDYDNEDDQNASPSTQHSNILQQQLHNNSNRSRRRRPPIRSNDHWKIVATPKTKNQWIAPTDNAVTGGMATSSSPAVSPTTTNPRLLFPDVGGGGSSSRSVASGAAGSSFSSSHPPFFPISTRALLQQRPERCMEQVENTAAAAAATIIASATNTTPQAPSLVSYY